MTEKQDMHSIIQTWELPHEPAKVWRALTEPTLIAQWLMKTDLRLDLGAEFTFSQESTPGWDGIIHSRILECVPQKRIRYAWNAKTGATPLNTTVTWTLSAIPGGTRLELEHQGFQAGNKFAFHGAGKGWNRYVDQKLVALLTQDL